MFGNTLTNIGRSVRACGIDIPISPSQAKREQQQQQQQQQHHDDLYHNTAAAAAAAAIPSSANGSPVSRNSSVPIFDGVVVEDTLQQDSPRGMNGTHVRGLADQSTVSEQHFSIADESDEDY